MAMQCDLPVGVDEGQNASRERHDHVHEGEHDPRQQQETLLLQ